MKKQRSIWIPPPQTTLRLLAELNKQVCYFKHRSKSIRSNRLSSEYGFFKKLVNYQSQLESIRNTLSHSIEISNVYWQPEPRDLTPTNKLELVTRYEQIEKLVSMGVERLAVGDQPTLNERFKSLESDLIFQYCDDFCLVHVKTPKDLTDAKSAILESVQARINKHLHQLRKEIGIRVFRLRSGLAIDRRARFRAIVHFIFKNLDDYDSEDYVLRRA
jgi:hypothetical protein